MKMVKRQISAGFNKEELSRIVKICKSLSMSKSGFIRFATMQVVGREEVREWNMRNPVKENNENND